MILYHGSNLEIEKINLARCRPRKDFGRGFYLTVLKEQAEAMARRTARIYRGDPWVTSYAFEETLLKSSGLSVLRFEKPTADWAMFVIKNRQQSEPAPDDAICNSDGKYDIVVGPIADDDLALLFRQFSAGLITVEILTEAMKYKRLTNQISFHTERAIKLLKKAGGYRV